MKLNRVNKTGKHGFHIFIDSDGKQVRAHNEKGDYWDIANGKVPRPTMEGMKYQSSHEAWCFDTVDGYLHHGDYAFVEEENQHLFKLGDDEYVLPKDGIEGGELTPIGLAVISKSRPDMLKHIIPNK